MRARQLPGAKPREVRLRKMAAKAAFGRFFVLILIDYCRIMMLKFMSITNFIILALTGLVSVVGV